MSGPAVDRHIFTDDSAITDLRRGLFAAVLEILRGPADYAADADLHPAAKRDVSLQGRTGSDHTVIADNAIFTHHRERADLDSLAELDIGRDDRARMDARTRHRSRTIAAMSASATTSPSTFPTPRILHTLPRSWTISSSKRIWSPGLTGRRNFTLSSDMK